MYMYIYVYVYTHIYVYIYKYISTDWTWTLIFMHLSGRHVPWNRFSVRTNRDCSSQCVMQFNASQMYAWVVEQCFWFEQSLFAHGLSVRLEVLRYALRAILRSQPTYFQFVKCSFAKMLRCICTIYASAFSNL